MPDKISRRDIFTKEILKFFFNLDSGKTTAEKEHHRESLERYFKSSMHSYPILQEMPWDLLVKEAEISGITVEGRDKNAIAKDLFLKIYNSA